MRLNHLEYRHWRRVPLDQMVGKFIQYMEHWLTELQNPLLLHHHPILLVEILTRRARRVVLPTSSLPLILLQLARNPPITALQSALLQHCRLTSIRGIYKAHRLFFDIKAPPKNLRAVLRLHHFLHRLQPLVSESARGPRTIQIEYSPH